ncbi:MAG: response regulator [Treponema sp.]|nr:response regulator [Treponema sp.]
MDEKKKNSVLVVDDENSNILALTVILSSDYTVYAAKSGQSAIQAAEKYVPDIILLDIIMSDMDGYEVISKLKTSEKTQDIPVIFISGLSSTGDEEKGLALGVADYITKPFSPAIVKLRLGNQIQLLEQKKQMKATIKSRETMLSAVNRAASLLLTADENGTFKNSFMEGMEIIGRSVDADCLEVWQNEMRDGELYAILKHYWFSETGRNIKSDNPVSGFPYSSVPGWEKHLSGGGYIQGPVSGLSREEQDFLSVFKIKTVLAIPTFIQNKFWGFCCIDDCRNSRNFTEDEIDILRSGSYMLANTINRNKMMQDLRDTSVQLQAAMEKALEDEERMQLILDTMPIACCLISRDNEFLNMNQAAMDMFDVTNDTEVNITEKYFAMLPEFQPCGRSSLELTEEHIEKAFTEGYHRFEWMYKKPNGEEIPCEDTLIRIKNKGEYILAGYARDLREQKAIIEEMRKAEIAEASNKAKSQFLANMSHEMRTPMNVIVGLTDLMLDEDDPTVNLTGNLKKINTAGNTLLGLINDVLDISKIEAGKLELHPVKYELPSFLNDIITLNMIRIEEKPIVFKLDINEELLCNLLGDDIRVKQIINNLLSNAFKYTQKGTITLGINCEIDGSDVWMSIYVRDTGMGIRHEDLQKLFSDYGQVDTRINRAIEGTGLGLAITKRLTGMMDGEITADSEYGKGSVFRLRIKQGFVDNAVIGPMVTENLCTFRYTDNKQKARKKLVRSNLSYAKVLVVDDMQTNLDVAAGLLGKYQLQIDCVTSGQAAIDYIRKEAVRYDAILMDHMMPGMDGMEAVRIIRSEIDSDYARTVPIIAVTANALIGSEAMFLASGFQAFLSKPIDILRLDEVLNKWVRDKDRENALPEKEPETTNKAEVTDTKKGLTESLVVPGLNTAAGLARFDNDEEMYLLLLESFSTHAPQQIKTIKTFIDGLQSADQPDVTSYRIAVHGLKGTCRSIGAEGIGSMAEKLEKAALQQDLTFITANSKQLADDLEELITGISGFIHATPAKI